MAAMDDAQRKELYADQQAVRREGPVGGLMTFNAEHGYLEALLRGLRSGFVKPFEYRQICQCDNLEDVKLTLGDTDYCAVLQNVNKLTPEVVHQKMEQKFVDEFKFIRAEATGPLSTFLDFITYEHQIKSISFIITSLIKGADPETLLQKCNPLGRTPQLRSIMTFENFEGADGLLELYRTVLVDTPVAPYFAKYFNSEIKGDQPGQKIQKVYDEVEIDIITNMLQKLWLEDFYTYCQNVGGDTWLVMKELLEFEADRRAISITLNSFGTPLNDPFNRDGERKALYCSFGKLYPEATLDSFTRVADRQQLQAALEPYPVYARLWNEASNGSRPFVDEFSDQLYRHEVALNCAAFDGQSHFACFYAFTKLKAQELRNMQFILSCIAQKRGAKDLNRWIPIFESRGGL